MNSDTPILITGANGFIGHKLYFELIKRGFRNITLLSRNSIQFQATSTIKFDFRDYKYLGQILDMVSPQIIFDTAAISSIDSAILDPQLTQSVNVLAPRELALWSKINRARLIHFSTDFVFDGEKSEYDENDKANPLSEYGKSKFEGDKEIMMNGENFAIIRPIMVFGWKQSWQRNNIFTWVIQELNAGNAISVTDDQFRMPTLDSDLAHNAIELALSKNLGIFHLSGPEKINVLKFTQKIAKKFQLDENLIRPIKTSELIGSQPRPLHSCYNLSKIKSIPNMQFTPIDEALEKLKLIQSKDRLV